jgi:hypothetical protein
MEMSGQLHAPVAIGYEARWSPEPVWMLWSSEKCLAPAGNRTLAVQPVPIPTELSRLLEKLLILPSQCIHAFLLCGLFCDVAILRIASNSMVNDKWERIWKEAAVA